MENDTELIRQQMVDTRSALSDKLEALQEQVLGTVEGTTRSVTDTVQTVQEAVQDTVSTVSETVTETVDSVKKSLDVTELVREHPWLAVGGAVALGYVGGRLLEDGAVLSSTVGSLSSVLGMVASSGTNGPTNGHAATAGPGAGQMVGDILQQLQGMALGTLAGIVTDMIRPNVPEAFRGHLDELSRDLTSKFGGPTQGSSPEGSAKAAH